MSSLSNFIPFIFFAVPLIFSCGKTVGLQSVKPDPISHEADSVSNLSENDGVHKAITKTSKAATASEVPPTNQTGSESMPRQEGDGVIGTLNGNNEKKEKKEIVDYEDKVSDTDEKNQTGFSETQVKDLNSDQINFCTWYSHEDDFNGRFLLPNIQGFGCGDFCRIQFDVGMRPLGLNGNDWVCNSQSNAESVEWRPTENAPAPQPLVQQISNPSPKELDHCVGFYGNGKNQLSYMDRLEKDISENSWRYYPIWCLASAEEIRAA